MKNQELLAKQEQERLEELRRQEEERIRKLLLAKLDEARDGLKASAKETPKEESPKKDK